MIFICVFAGLVVLLVIDKIMGSFENSNVSNEGRRRYIHLWEYECSRKRRIVANQKYPLFYCVKDSVMENKMVEFSIDENAFIIPSKMYDNADMVLAFLGDSTTECALVDPQNRFPYLVGRILEERTGKKINSYNAGYSGANSYSILLSLVCKIIPLKPDKIFYCSSFHDIMFLTTHDDFYSSCSERVNVYSDEQLANGLWRRCQKVIRMLFPNIYLKLYIFKEKIFDRKKREIEPNEIRIISQTKKKEMLKYVEMNINSFVDICKNVDIEPILMTQVNNFRLAEKNTYIMEIYKTMLEEVIHISFADFAELFDSVNKLVRKIAKDKGVQLIDLDLEIPKERDCIYDLVHFTDKGSRIAAEYIADAIRI